MTPAEFKAAKERTGLSSRQLAVALDQARPVNPRTIRRWMRGDQRVPDWVGPRMAKLTGAQDSMGTGRNRSTKQAEQGEGE